MKKNTGIILVGLALLGLAFIFFNPIQSNENKEVREVKLGLTENGGADAVLDFAEEKGYLKKAGIKVSKVETGTNTVALMTSGEVDVVTNRMASSVTQFLSGEDIQFVGVLEKYPSIHYGVSRVPIKDVKKVGVVRLGGALHLSLVQILEKNGIDVSKIEFVITGSASKQRLAMLEKGEIDLALITFDELKNIDKNKYVITEPHELYKDVYSPLGIVLTKKKAEEKRNEIQAYVSVMKKTNDYILNHKTEYIEFLKNKFKISQEEAEMTYKDYVNARENLSFVPNANDIEDVVRVVKEIAKPKQPDRNIQDFVNQEFAKKAK